NPSSRLILYEKQDPASGSSCMRQDCPLTPMWSCDRLSAFQERRRSMSCRLSTSLLLIAFLAYTLCGQVNTSTAIRGLITDSSGAAVASAQVTIRNAATGEEHSTLSDSTGFYSVPSLVPGTYSVSVRHPGFKRAEVTDRVA